MSTPDPVTPHRPPPTVFLSYASEDRQAAQGLRDALPGLGLEVWYDESGLSGGDAWDQKIRRQIRECDFFMPLISAHTEARAEGYFRREWRLAVERTLDMADDHTFLLPVVIDETAEAGARVPDRFVMVQWVRVPGGQPNAALEALCRRLVAGQPIGAQPARRAPGTVPHAAAASPRPAASGYPKFPRREAGHHVPYGLRVAGWGLQSAWIFFNRLPRWVQWCLYAWLIIVLLSSRSCMYSGHDEERSGRKAPRVPPTPTELPDKDLDAADTAAATKLGTQIAEQFTGVAQEALAGHKPLLAIPFSVPSGDAAARGLADSTFSQLFGKVAVLHAGQVAMATEPLPSLDASDAAARGRARHSAYVIYGAVEGETGKQSLTVKIVSVANGAVAWSKSYPVAGADPGRIAAEAAEKVPTPGDE